MNRLLPRRFLPYLLMLPILSLAGCPGGCSDNGDDSDLLSTVDTVVLSTEMPIASTAASAAPMSLTAVFDPGTNADVSKSGGKLTLVTIDHVAFGCSTFLGNGNTISGTWTLHLDDDPATTTHALGTVANASLETAVRSADGLTLDRSTVSDADKKALQNVILQRKKAHITFTGTVSGPCQARISLMVPAKLSVTK